MPRPGRAGSGAIPGTDRVHLFEGSPAHLLRTLLRDLLRNRESRRRISHDPGPPDPEAPGDPSARPLSRLRSRDGGDPPPPGSLPTLPRPPAAATVAGLLALWSPDLHAPGAGRMAVRNLSRTAPSVRRAARRLALRAAGGSRDPRRQVPPPRPPRRGPCDRDGEGAAAPRGRPSGARAAALAQAAGPGLRPGAAPGREAGGDLAAADLERPPTTPADATADGPLGSSTAGQPAGSLPSPPRPLPEGSAGEPRRAGRRRVHDGSDPRDRGEYTTTGRGRSPPGGRGGRHPATRRWRPRPMTDADERDLFLGWNREGDPGVADVTTGNAAPR